MVHTPSCDLLGGWETPGEVPNRERGACHRWRKKIETSVSYLFDMNLAWEDGYSPAHHEQHWPRASKSINYTKPSGKSAHFSRWKQRSWWKLHASRWASSLLGILVLSVVEPIVQDLRHGSRSRWMACACVWFPRHKWTCKCMSILRSTVLVNAKLSLIAVDSNLNSWRLSVKLGDWKLEGRRVSWWAALRARTDSKHQGVYSLDWHFIQTDTFNVLFSRTPVLACSLAAPVNSDTCRLRTPSASRLPSGNNVPDSEAGEIDSVQVFAESAALENYFQHGFRQEMNGDEVEESEGSENGEDEQEEGVINEDEDSQIVDNPRTHLALAWADKFILETRWKEGCQTENSVLKLWKVCRKSSWKFAGVTSHSI